MLFRLLIFAVLAAIVYRAIKALQGGESRRESSRAAPPPDRVDDVMIKDPLCGTYFPQRNAVALSQENRDVYFCSTACRDRYLAQQSKDQPH